MNIFPYLFALAITTLVTAATYFTLGYTPSFWNFVLGISVYVAFVVGDIYKSLHILNTVHEGFVLGDKKLGEVFKKVIENKELLDNLIEFSFSAIICVVATVVGYFYYPLVVIGYVAGCVIMCLSTRIRNMVFRIIANELNWS